MFSVEKSLPVWGIDWSQDTGQDAFVAVQDGSEGCLQHQHGGRGKKEKRDVWNI